MSRYIDADALVDFVLNNTPHINGETTMQCAVNSINEAPTADVVEVVRCKDCCHYKQNPWNKEDELLCQCWGDWLPTEPDDFCSYGAKMDGDKL